ncbi:MAG: hypothetical protein QOE28_870 [Solirubrobacteraceae bacterium]|jgi:uncharacterized protein YndB with AHSA1/START domain|nr:hypothetical protein [Solirubrobacteraceae bacterium]
MPPTEIHIDASPERVWEELALPKTYEHWVVGSRTIESWDPEFPAAGTKFEHTQGKAPFVIRDETAVLASDPPRRLELLVKARPLLEAHVILELRPEGSGTRVVMEELPVRGLMALPLRLPPGRALTRLRNTEALRRVKKRAEDS